MLHHDETSELTKWKEAKDSTEETSELMKWKEAKDSTEDRSAMVEKD
jgi:hypothetical protein